MKEASSSIYGAAAQLQDEEESKRFRMIDRSKVGWWKGILPFYSMEEFNDEEKETITHIWLNMVERGFLMGDEPGFEASELKCLASNIRDMWKQKQIQKPCEGNDAAWLVG